MSVPAARAQCTLRNSIGCVGVGLHSGLRTALRLHPAPTDHGIRFRRSDRLSVHDIRACLDAAVATRLCLVLAEPTGVRIAGVEHLLGALSICGIDNVLIEISGPEVPAMDGSAQSFVFLIECAGIERQDAEQPQLELLQPVTVGDCYGRAMLRPAGRLEINVEGQWPDVRAADRPQHSSYAQDALSTEIAPARECAHEDEIARLGSHGLARGASTKNLVLYDDQGLLNEEGLRYPDEAVRHRALDTLGALALLGMPLRASYYGSNADHRLDLRLLRTLMADVRSWRIRSSRPPVREGSRTASASGRKELVRLG